MIVFIGITILLANFVCAKSNVLWLSAIALAVPVLGLVILAIIAIMGAGALMGWGGSLALGLIIIVGLWKLIDDNIKASHQKIEETKK